MPNYSVDVPDTIQVAVYADLDTRLIFSSLTFRHIASPPVSSDAQALVDVIRPYWISYMLPLLSRDYVHSVVIGLGLDPFGSIIVGAFGANTPGGYPEQALPNNVGFRIDFHTGVDGRAYRGWNTVSGIPRSQALHNHVNQTWADNVLGVYIGLGPLANAVGWEWVVTSTMEASTPRATGLTTPITTCSYKDLTIDSCRHRIPGRRIT